jgi:hypothetical protein
MITGGADMLLARQYLLAVAAVTDIAINGRDVPVPAKDVASRLKTRPRYLDPYLQSLASQRILSGVPRLGYKLARNSRFISILTLYVHCPSTKTISGFRRGIERFLLFVSWIWPLRMNSKNLQLKL